MSFSDVNISNFSFNFDYLKLTSLNLKFNL